MILLPNGNSIAFFPKNKSLGFGAPYTPDNIVLRDYANSVTGENSSNYLVANGDIISLQVYSDIPVGSTDRNIIVRSVNTEGAIVNIFALTLIAAAPTFLEETPFQGLNVFGFTFLSSIALDFFTLEVVEQSSVTTTPVEDSVYISNLIETVPNDDLETVLFSYSSDKDNDLNTGLVFSNGNLVSEIRLKSRLLKLDSEFSQDDNQLSSGSKVGTNKVFNRKQIIEGQTSRLLANNLMNLFLLPFVSVNKMPFSVEDFSIDGDGTVVDFEAVLSLQNSLVGFEVLQPLGDTAILASDGVAILAIDDVAILAEG